MVQLSKPPKVVQKTKDKAVIEIKALWPGYGLTIANSLRRILLSSLGGAAITQVKIKGVGHEFSTIPGVLEDVVLILLSLKKLRFKLFTEEPQTITLKKKGEGEVKGKDFKLSSQVKLVNPEVHIATLTSKKAELDMEAKIEKGVGYEPAEARETEKTEIGVIALDAIFNPVKKVSFKIENMRVEKRTDFDKLRLEIETDGTLDPVDAFHQASEILLKHFALFSKATTAEEKAIPKAPKTKPAKTQSAKKKEKTSKKIKKDEKKKKRKKT